MEITKTQSAPLVSVIMPAYKQAQYIGDALDSLLNQTYTNWEVAVVDDGSPDNVESIAKEYAAKDSRIKFHHTENGGVAHARNYGVSVTSGSFILPLDADDLFSPDYIEKCIGIFMSHPKTSLVYCQWEFFGTKKKLTKLKYLGYRDLLIENTIFCSAMFKREDFIKAGGYDEKIPYGYEDWELWLRLLNENSIVYQLEERLFKYRIKDISRSEDANKAKNRLITNNYIYNKHKDKYNRYFPDIISELQQLHRLSLWKEKVQNRPVYKRLWHAIKGDL